MKKEQILKEIVKNNIYQNILVKYFSEKNERDEFRQFLFIQICEIDDEKIELIWSKNEFLWYYCGIVKNQVKSSSSAWNKYRESFKKNVDISVFENYLENNDEESYEDEINEKLSQIKQSINHYLKVNPKYKTDFDLFKLKYEQGLTYRAIAKKTNIPLTSVYQYILNATTLIQTHIRFKKEKIR